MQSDFKPETVLSYLGLPKDYEPSPSSDAIEFLRGHVHQLPPQIGRLFSSITTPKRRTAVPVIRNRRLKYTNSHPEELSFVSAKSRWPSLWRGRDVPGKEAASDEREWADKSFLSGQKQQVGKLGTLLGDYEEEREGERVRSIRRERAMHEEFVAEEEEEDEEEESDSDQEEVAANDEEESPAESQALFERLIKERFIYGFLESIDYDAVDWNDALDEEEDRDAEERWFDEDE